MKNKLVEIITNTQTNCVGKDCNKCSYNGQEHCLINRVADKLLEMYERLQKENERLYEIKLDLENQLIQSGLTEYLGADEIEKETATTILKKLQPYIGGWVLFKELEKQFGVEIKEDEI